jgi:hypothetical protein
VERLLNLAFYGRMRALDMLASMALPLSGFDVSYSLATGSVSSIEASQPGFGPSGKDLIVILVLFLLI